MERKAWTGALWHQYCDAFIGVVATTKFEAERQLDSAAEEEYERCVDQETMDDIEYEDDICSSGVFFDTVELTEEENEELEETGYVFPSVA